MAKNEGFDIAKRAVAVLLVLGALLLWVGLLLGTLGTGGTRDAGRILGFTGALFAFVVAIAGGLGSKRTSDLQNLGLLVVAAGFLLVAIRF